MRLVACACVCYFVLSVGNLCSFCCGAMQEQRGDGVGLHVLLNLPTSRRFGVYRVKHSGVLDVGCSPGCTRPSNCLAFVGSVGQWLLSSSPAFVGRIAL